VTAAGSSCDRGVDVAPAGRGGDVEGAVAVVPDRSQPRLPAPGEQRANRQQNRRGGAFARADGERKLSRAEAGAPLGGHVVGAGAGADGGRARVHLQHVHLQHVHQSRAQRSGRADRKLRALQAWLLAGPGTPAGGGLVSLGSKRLVTKLIAGWIVLPAL
jgi:selenocysteine lyase/cysteine desulfurase